MILIEGVPKRNVFALCLNMATEGLFLTISGKVFHRAGAATKKDLKRFAKTKDNLKLGWLPIHERRQFNLLKLSYKAIHNRHWSTRLKLNQYVPARTLRSGSTFKIQCNVVPTIFRHSAATLFNSLPANIRESHHFSDFLSKDNRF